MNARAAAFVLFRLLALYLVTNYGLNLVAQGVLILFSPATHINADGWLPAVLAFGMMAGNVLVGLVLWSGASWFAMRVGQRFPEAFHGDIGAAHWQALVISGAGWFAIFAAGRMLVSAIRSAADPSVQSKLLFVLVPLGGYVAVGVLLIVFPATIIYGLNALRGWGGMVRDWAEKPLVEDETP